MCLFCLQLCVSDHEAGSLEVGLPPSLAYRCILFLPDGYLPLPGVQEDSSDRQRGDEMTNPEKHEKAAPKLTSTCQQNDERLSGKWSAFQLQKELNRNQLKILSLLRALFLCKKPDGVYYF